MRSNSEIVDLIVLLYKQKGYSLSKLSTLTKIPKSSLSRYFNKNRQFPINKTNIFAQALNVSEEYILGVTTKSQNKNTQTSTHSTTIQSIVNTSIQLEEKRQESVLFYAKEQLEEQEKHLIIEETETAYKTLQHVTVIESLAAGRGYSYMEQNETYEVYTDKENLKGYDIASFVTGDSMTPDYQNGDVVLIKKGYDNIQGGVYAIDYNGKSYLKKVYNEGNRFRLVSTNKKYDDIYIDVPVDEDIYFNIIGSVVDSFTPIEK